MFEKLEKVLKKYQELEKRLSDPAILKDQPSFQKTAREHKELGQVVEIYGKWRRLKGEIEGARALLDESDQEMRELAQDEIDEKEPLLPDLEERLRRLMLPKDLRDAKNVILEIRAGTGGDEAALFASDLYRMYVRYAELRGWKIEELSQSETDMGGIKEAIVLIKGEGAYSRLRYESGTHRVQRVPATENQGRIHTSAATVAVLPEADPVEVNLQENELRFDVYRSSGPGGQSVNTTDSAVRVTHLPTGIVVTCQDEKSQHKNKAKALKILSSHLLDYEMQKQHDERSAARKSQVGSGDRSERIRTYNFPQDRITDHRIGLTLHNLDRFLEGEIEEMVDSLIQSKEAERLAEFEESGSEIPAG
ncbi:MAG: peptide chain release factor 1 [bacterium]|nr:peptide chain release factor 1 [bacterium]